jgi:hypothetical protein
MDEKGSFIKIKIIMVQLVSSGSIHEMVFEKTFVKTSYNTENKRDTWYRESL